MDSTTRGWCVAELPNVDDPAAAFQAAFEWHRAGRLDEARAAYERLLQHWPTHVAALGNLGVILARQGEPVAAEQLYHRALAADPAHVDTHFNLGNLYRRLDQLPRADECYREALRLNPHHASARFNHGLVLTQLGCYQQAEEAFRAVLVEEPGNPEARLRLGDLLLRCGRPVEGIEVFQAYMRDYPADPRGYYNYGLAIASQGKAGEAAECFHKALQLRPQYAEAHNALGLALELLGRKDDAIFHFEQAVQIEPHLADAWCNLGTNFMEQGRTEDARVCLQHSLKIRPQAAAIHSNLLLLGNYSSEVSPEALRDEHFAWAERFTTPVPPPPPVPPPHDPTRRLRLGYLSADFRTHPVAGLLEACFTHHDRSQVEIFAYPTLLRTDETTQRLNELTDHWKPITGKSDREAAELIAQDHIDVLLDLSGHTAGNRLIVMAYRPAPVQVTLFGYPNTTGMPAVDYRLTDPISDPPGQTESLYRETLLRLPEVPWVYWPPHEAPEVSPLPAATKKPFVFGCLNNSAKISQACLAAWAKLIQSAPGSRLILLAGGSQAAAKRLMDRFARAGILRERIQLVPRLPRDKYFEMYHQIDIALDPFPYNGGVTTCDALYMGVPVLTLAGRSYAARQGVMQMLNLGLGEFVADSEATLIETARHWMSQREQLAELRASLRDRLLASPLAQAGRYVRHLEAALRRVWQQRLPNDDLVPLHPLAPL